VSINITKGDRVFTPSIRGIKANISLLFGFQFIITTRHKVDMQQKVGQKVDTHTGFYYFGSSDLINWQRITGINHLTGKN